MAREAVKKSERVAATPQTVAKLKPDPMEAWRVLWIHWEGKRGGLSQEEFDAIQEIREAYRLITGKLWLRPAGWMRLDVTRESEHWPQAVTDLVEKYNTWAEDMHRAHRSILRALDNIIDDGDGWMPDYDIVKGACGVWLNGV